MGNMKYTIKDIINNIRLKKDIMRGSLDPTIGSVYYNKDTLDVYIIFEREFNGRVVFVKLIYDPVSATRMCLEDNVEQYTVEEDILIKDYELICDFKQFENVEYQRLVGFFVEKRYLLAGMITLERRIEYQKSVLENKEEELTELKTNTDGSEEGN